MALVDMFEIVHDMTDYGRNMIQVYHVKRENAGETSGAISDAFQHEILPALRALQSNTVVNNELRIFNLGSPTDFGTFTLAGAFGLRAGARSPSYVSAAVRFPSKNRLVRSGQKRFPGMLEADYTAGAIVAATKLLIDDICDLLIANWLASADNHHVCNYAIIKRICETVDPVSGKCLQYRLPEDDGELVFYEPTQFIKNNEISSQVSRKVF